MLRAQNTKIALVEIAEANDALIEIVEAVQALMAATAAKETARRRRLTKYKHTYTQAQRMLDLEAAMKDQAAAGEWLERALRRVKA